MDTCCISAASGVVGDRAVRYRHGTDVEDYANVVRALIIIEGAAGDRRFGITIVGDCAANICIGCVAGEGTVADRQRAGVAVDADVVVAREGAVADRQRAVVVVDGEAVPIEGAIADRQ